MTKTNKVYEKRPRDYYPTPKSAVMPIRHMLPKGFSFCEPCAGDGRLVSHLEELTSGQCFFASDIEPGADWIVTLDGNDLDSAAVEYCEYIITNPPFTWGVLQPMLEKWISLRPTLVLLPADFMHNKRVAPLMTNCVWVKSIGRVKWIEGSKGAGVENYAWYMFVKNHDKPTHFYGR
jgi:hypothetical protein